jgi:NitT/TauT family transport system substrate-binding protein
MMTEARWKQTYEFLVAGGLLKPEVNWKAGFTDRFVKDLKIAP